MASAAPRRHPPPPRLALAALQERRDGTLGTWCAALVRSRQGRRRLAQTPEESERRARRQIMPEVDQIGDTQARQARFGQLEQRLRPLPPSRAPADSQELEARLAPGVPRGVGTLLSRLFEPEGAAGQVHAHQPHAVQAGFVHCAHARASLSMCPPSCAQAAALARIACSKACRTPRTALGEQPTGASRGRRPQHSLIVAALPPRWRPQRKRGATPRRRSPPRPSAVAHPHASG